MITKILHKSVSIAQHVVGGVARGGLHGAVAMVRRIRPGDEDAPADHTSPTVSTEPVRQPPSPTTPTETAPAKKTVGKKTTAKKTVGKKTTAKKTTVAKKPNAALDEERAPADDDPVVPSSGPDVAASAPKDDPDDLRP